MMDETQLTPHNVPYNNTNPNGGDSLTQDLNVFYEVHIRFHHITTVGTSTVLMFHHDQAGDLAWMLTATALVLLMIPGVG